MSPSLDFRGETIAGTEVALDYTNQRAFVDGTQMPDYETHFSKACESWRHDEFRQVVGNVRPLEDGSPP
jgi:hypothetical protein